ncbi:hypothetical protein [Gordonia sp. UCD-TK1]|uniref:hypothetical protein n=1 Tax=Gordonia sp. UCD-TK1 TaxID=1857893 RepID=UPI00080ECDBF|nr:hypothetical protein [Gordonia sp. UCD-TK1]OCH79841.1 hypothetical protein A9310_23395 [Gordonia sp. UCD-TK1]
MSQGARPSSIAPSARTAQSPSQVGHYRPVNRDELGNTPTIIGRDAAVQFCNSVLGVPITFTRMRRGFERRELTVWKVGGVNATSPQALYDWIQGMARPAVSQGGAA